MSEKYIDLASRISNESGAYHLRDTIIEGVLEWLDDNPDQVPGRTITRSEYRDTLDHAVLVSGYGDDWERGFNTGLAVGGTKVVPDPEPTNAERLEQLQRSWVAEHPVPGGMSLIEYLDEAGVKAPGGDDE